VKEFENSIFINLMDPDRNEYGIKFIYDKNQNKYSLVGNLSLEDLNNLFSNYTFDLEYDRDALQICRYITIFKHPNIYVRFIADIKELLLEAVAGNPYPYYNLDTINQFLDIKIELPEIIRDNDNTIISYYFARHDYITKATARFKGNTLTDYKEENIAEVLFWYGTDRLY
jgi:hypothetical protein